MKKLTKRGCIVEKCCVPPKKDVAQAFIDHLLGLGFDMEGVREIVMSNTLYLHDEVITAVREGEQ